MDCFLPPRLLKSADVNCLTYKANKERYNDNSCLLTAVCKHKTDTEKLDEETSTLLSAILYVNSISTAENLRGFVLEDLHIVEHQAKVSILVYHLEVTDNGIVGDPAQRSLRRFNSTATLLH